MNARILGSLCLASLATLPVAAPSAAAVPNAQPPTIVVSGTAHVTREPDIAHITLSVETNADRAAQATQQNARLVAHVRSAIQKLDIPASSIVTEFYNVRYQPRPAPSPGAPVPPLRRPVGAMPIFEGGRYGYIVTHVLAITAKPAQVGAVIDAAVDAGATSVGGVTYDLSDRHGAYLQALREAVADARSQAQAAAAASGARLGEIERIFVGSPPRFYPQPVPLGVRLEGALSVPTEVTPGALHIFATVNVTYRLLP